MAPPTPALLENGNGSTSQRVVRLNSCPKLFIKRDFTQGLNVRFDSDYPTVFRGVISEDTWADTIHEINNIFMEAEEVCCASIMETILGCLTCYCSRLVSRTIYEKKMHELEGLLNRLNEDTYMPAGLLLLNPMERGLRVIEICIVDPDTQQTMQERGVGGLTIEGSSMPSNRTITGASGL